MNNNFTRYIKITISSIALVLIVVVIFNRLMDPYSFYDGPDFEGVNVVKPYMPRHLRMVKVREVRYKMPSGTLLGSSRGEFGLDPLHRGWAASKVYNLSISGSSIYEMLRYFQHAHAVHPQEQVVLGLSLRQFKHSEQVTDGFSEERLAVTVDGDAQGDNVLLDFFHTNASLKTLRYSMKTRQRQYETPQYLLQGEANPKFLAENKNGGRKDFIESEKLYCNTTFRDFSFTDDKGEASTFLHFRQLLAEAYADSIDLKILIYPSHARQWEVIDLCGGLWDSWETWKRQLVAINEDEAKKANLPAFFLWDFSGYNTYTSEEVPMLNDTKNKMQWYWESSHFKKELGDRVLDRVFDYRDSSREIATDFGVLLTSKNIEVHLQRIRADRKDWRESHTGDIKEITLLIGNKENPGQRAILPGN